MFNASEYDPERPRRSRIYPDHCFTVCTTPLTHLQSLELAPAHLNISPHLCVLVVFGCKKDFVILSGPVAAWSETGQRRVILMWKVIVMME